MDTLDTEVLNAVCDWLEAGHTAHLFTVVQTWGSAPRPVGSMLSIRDDGRVKGSVSGGCIEDDLIQRVRQGEFHGCEARRLTYGVSTEEARRFGLPCGGKLELIAESLIQSDWVHDLARRVRSGQLVERTLELKTGNVTLRGADLKPYETSQTYQASHACPSETAREARSDEQHTSKEQTAITLSDTHLRSLHGPQWRLFIVGAGQISDYLAPMAQAVGFAVTVCDPREEYADTWNVPGTQLLKGMPDDELLNFRPDTRTAIVMLTHDPKLDDLALIDALPSAAFYVGALGSLRNQAARRERLMTHFNVSESHFARLHGPVGLNIGSRTPPEIAVSIMAQIIAEKNARTPRGANISEGNDQVSSSSACQIQMAEKLGD